MANRVDQWTEITTRFYQWREGLGTATGGFAALIAERPTIISVQRAAGDENRTLPDQVVRIELDSSMTVRPALGRGVSSALVNLQKIILLGYRNEENGIPDTDLQEYDRFFYSGQYFTVKKVEMGMTDHLQAEAEADG